MIPAYCCDSNLLHPILERPLLFLNFVTLWWQRDFLGLTALKASLVYSFLEGVRIRLLPGFPPVLQQRYSHANWFSSWQTILLAFPGTSSLWTSSSSQLLQIIYLSSKYQQFATWTDPTEILQWPKDPTVIGKFAIVLFAAITVCSLQIQLALLKPLPNFFTPILFCSHALQFVYNLEKVLETIRSLSYSIV